MVSPLLAVDDEPSRATLKGIRGVYIIVETFQPNFQDFAKKSGLTREQLEKQAHVRLNEAGIAVLSREEWLTTPGRPVLYINLNTHEGEKYWFAYDVRIETPANSRDGSGPCDESIGLHMVHERDGRYKCEQAQPS